MLLAEYDCNIKYAKGESNSRADMLSRMEESDIMPLMPEIAMIEIDSNALTSPIGRHKVLNIDVDSLIKEQKKELKNCICPRP